MHEPPNREQPTYSLLRIPVAAGRRREFIERFTALDVFKRASDAAGMKRGWLLRPVAEDGELVVVAEWVSTGAYEGWLQSPVRAEVNADLAAYAAGDMTGGTFVVADSFASDGEVHLGN